MFQKPAFGANTSGFGMQPTFGTSASTTASPFGSFKPTTGTSAFGAPPAFGASTSAQPATGGGLFGSTNTTGGLFGTAATTAPAPAFGGSNSFAFGGNTSGGLFGANNTTSGLFGGTQANTGFGAKPAGFGFGGTTTNTPSGGGLFGNTPSTGTGLFGQQTNALTGGGGLFSNTAGGFGQAQQASGTAHVKYNPVVGTDVIVKSGTSQNINIKHHCITCMKEYEGKSLEELRLEDYTAGRKGSTTGVFAFQQQENKPLFPQTTPGFGQTATTTASSVFGGGGLTTGGFGQTNAFSFGGNTATNTNTTGLFGANKPAFGATPATGTGLFGATATTQAPAFGATNTSTFGFGSNLQNQSSGGLFGAKPATSVFGSAPASSGFGSFGGTPSLFQAKPLQTQAPTFGPSTGVGTLAGGFGTNTSTSGLFGGNTAFGKPATTTPAFGFSQPTVGLNTGLGTNTFQTKPNTGFGTLGGGMFNQQPANNTFRTGLDSGLGGGIFGNNSALGGASLGLGMNANNTALTNSSLGASAAGNVHEQILTLAARPYGDSPLFKDLLPDSSTTAEEVLKPTNPAAVSAVLERSTYRVSPATGTSLQLRIDGRHHADKKSLFDGLEESDPSLEDKLTLKPSRKRLVLRPKQTTEQDYNHNISRSQDDTPRNGITNDEQTDKENSQRAEEIDRARKNLDFPDGHTSNNITLDSSNDRQGSWLSSSKLPWNEKEKPIDNEPTPTARLYPNLDKELPTESDRRASWLTTKPLRKPLATAGDQENSVQELGVRTSHVFSISQDKENVDTLSGIFKLDASSSNNRTVTLEMIADQISNVLVSEEENVVPQEAPPHPTGVRLTRPGYYTIPSLDEMISYMRSDGSCVVPHLTIGRTNYGNVYYDSEIDVAGLDLDSLVHFLNKEVIIYPEDADKPPVGSGLNRRAIVTLDRIWPRDKTDRTHITDPDRLLKMDYEGKLRRVCDKHDTKFIEYRPQTGSWVFRVEHFSKYGLTDSDEEDDVTPDVLKRQLVNQSLQKNAAPASIPPLAPVAGLGGLGLGGLGVGGLANMSVGGLAGLASVSNMPLDTRPMRGLGAQPGFEMDTTEDSTESQSLYQDNKVYGVKSPTTELARLENRQSHHVQLMKASLYADTAMEDDVSVSTGDQLVPLSTPHIPMDLLTEHAPCIPLIQHDDGSIEDLSPEELQLKPLIVKPHTIVLKYHRKIPPFKQTIAGRVNASCIADMSVCRARHARAGFGPGTTIAYLTTFNCLADNERDADLSELNRYVIGRGEDDWSEPIVARLAINEPDVTYDIPEFLSKNLQVVYKYSTLVPTEGDACPRLQLVQSPRERRQALNEIIENAATVRECTPKFGVSGAYCYQVFRLCDALWGEDLDNDGIPGTDDISIVTRYRKFLAWITSAVADVTDKQLSKPIQPENEDECDHHSARIWTLLLGGRLLDACKVAKDNGDLNMAALIAQAAGEPSFRSLISRQLSVYRECGASTLISKHRLAALELISGTPPMEHLVETHWLTALHATARYLCTQVPSLEQIVTKYTSLFSEEVESGDLSRVTADDMGMSLPTPPYTERLDVYSEETKRRTLDLRYELIRARAFNARPRLAPEHYTEDPFDYSLCVILGLWFGSIDAACILSAADQLQPHCWHNAVLLLMYLQDDRLRTHLIREVLSRHVPAKVDTPELRARLEFIKKLGVPDKWVYLAQAHRAKYEHLPQLEAEYLVGAEQWNAAHKVLIDELLPNAVLSDNLQSISSLLEKLNEAAKRHEIHGWESGGRALYNYIHVCSEIRSLLRHGGDVPGRLEALRPAVAAAIQATKYLPTDSPLAVAGRVELAARALNLVRAAGAGPAQAAALLHALKLPPDTNAHTQHQITMDLAEQASELCIESVTSSPVSSHHRATAAS